jgi:p-hydroxybenzoate 3-monooxygenase
MRIVWAGRDGFFIDVASHVGKRFTTYGQTQIQEDLFAAADRRGATVLTEVADVQLMQVASERPYVTFSHRGATARVDCDFIAGCDGFHGVTRAAIPRALLREFEKVYPFGWLGVLSPTPPLPDIVYASHPRGFALASARNPTLSRYYIQVPLETKIEDWSDDRFWAELKARYPPSSPRDCHGRRSKSIAPCVAMSRSRCGTAVSSSQAMPPTSFRPPAPRD